MLVFVLPTQRRL